LIDQAAKAAATRFNDRLGTVTPKKIIAAWKDVEQPGKNASDWLDDTYPELSGRMFDALMPPLLTTWRRAWMLGQHAGKTLVSAMDPPVEVKKDPTLSFDVWVTTYSNPLVEEIVKTRLDDFAKLLEITSATGLTDDDIEIFSVADATTIMVTEVTRLAMLAAYGIYQGSGVSEVSWVLGPGDPCTRCAENESGGPVLIGSEFPSGDQRPPAHPSCRCGVVPVSAA